MIVERQRRRLVLAGVLLTVLAQAAALGLVGLAGWFIAACAIAGATVASTFSYLAPSGGIRAFALTRIGASYGSRVLLHQASLATATRDRGRLLESVTGGGRPAAGAAAEALLHDVALADERLIRVTAPLIVFGASAAATVTAVAIVSPAAAAVLLVGAAGIAAAMRPAARTGQRREAARLRQEVVAAVDAWPELRSLGAVAVLRDRIEVLAAGADTVEASLRAADRAVRIRCGVLAAVTLASVVLLITVPRTLPVPEVVLVALLCAGALESGAAVGAAAGSWRLIRDAEARIRTLRRSDEHPVRSAGGAVSEVLAAARPGATLVVCGPSGSGKTTLLREVQDRLGSGAVLVAPDGHLFDGTVSTNLRIGAPELTASAAEAILVALRLDRTGVALSTPVGSSGRAFSGGEHQRLLLARAVAAAPPVLLLDEPATGLGHDAADGLVEVLRGLLPSSTIIVALHEDSVTAPHWSWDLGMAQVAAE